MDPRQLTSDAPRHDATERDTSRHTLTVKQASQLFAGLGVPRSPRSVQRFCDVGHIDCIAVRGEKTERYFIEPTSIERYAHELKALEQFSRVDDDDTSRHDAPQRDMTRNDATERVIVEEPTPEPKKDPNPEAPAVNPNIKRLEDEIVNLRIDNRAKEQVINMLRDERAQITVRIEEVSYRLGAAESRVAQLEAPKPVEEDAPTPVAIRRVTYAVVKGTPAEPITVTPEPVAPLPEPPTPEPQPLPKRSFFGRLLG